MTIPVSRYVITRQAPRIRSRAAVARGFPARAGTRGRGADRGRGGDEHRDHQHLIQHRPHHHMWVSGQEFGGWGVEGVGGFLGW